MPRAPKLSTTQAPMPAQVKVAACFKWDVLMPVLPGTSSTMGTGPSAPSGRKAWAFKVTAPCAVPETISEKCCGVRLGITLGIPRMPFAKTRGSVADTVTLAEDKLSLMLDSLVFDRLDRAMMSLKRAFSLVMNSAVRAGDDSTSSRASSSSRDCDSVCIITS